MDQEKVGKFIAECRKKKKLTQVELADKLSVSEKSVSNWENGRNMPDLALFKPLCDELDISINELMSGEIINKNNYQEKLEENIINTINYSNDIVSKNRRTIGLILFFLGITLSMFGVMVFSPDSHACSFSIVGGMIFSVLGFFQIIKSKSYIKNLLCLLSFFLGFMLIILLFDFMGVKYNDRPPIFSVKIVTVDDTIYYDTLFYDVLRCNKNSKDETYKVIKNSDYDDIKILNMCK